MRTWAADWRDIRPRHKGRRVGGKQQYKPPMVVMDDDETTVEVAACSLGMGTKMIPSNRYGR